MVGEYSFSLLVQTYKITYIFATGQQIAYYSNLIQENDDGTSRVLISGLVGGSPQDSINAVLNFFNAGRPGGLDMPQVNYVTLPAQIIDYTHPSNSGGGGGAPGSNSKAIGFALLAADIAIVAIAIGKK
jgi:hypothetical protein